MNFNSVFEELSSLYEEKVVEEVKPKRGRKKKVEESEAPAFCMKCGSALNANGECEACNPKVETHEKQEEKQRTFGKCTKIFCTLPQRTFSLFDKMHKNAHLCKSTSANMLFCVPEKENPLCPEEGIRDKVKI